MLTSQNIPKTETRQMGAYDRFMQLVTEDGRESLVPCTQSPFRLLVDDEARREIIERVGRYGATRGHRNPVKAESEDLELDSSDARM